MTKKIKYSIIYGVVGLFVSYIIYEIVGTLAWLLILGDGPTSLIQNIVATIFVFGVTFGFWVFVVYLGYRQGGEAENNLNSAEKNKESLHFIGKAVLKIILAIIIAAMVLFAFIFWKMKQ